MISIKPKKLFLIDAIGALISSTFIAFGVFYLDDFIRMPKKILIILCLIPVLYFFYSFTYYLKAYKNEKLKNPLKIIAISNLCYSVLTLSLLFYFFPKITVLEMTYFILEVMILIVLSIAELNASKEFDNE